MSTYWTIVGGTRWQTGGDDMSDHILEIPQDIANSLSFYLSRSVFWDGVDCANIVAEEAKCGSALSTKAMEARTWMLNALRRR